MVIFEENYHFSRFRGGPTSSRGSNFFQGGGGRGSNCLFPIETNITCDFLGGPDPLSPSGSEFALITSVKSFPFGNLAEIWKSSSVRQQLKTKPVSHIHKTFILLLRRGSQLSTSAQS